MRKLIVTIICLSSLYLYAQTPVDSLNLRLSEVLGESDLPGFAVAIIRKDGIVYQNGFGCSNLEQKEPYTINGVQTIASISKVLIGISVMQLIERGEMTLETGINEILPFTVANPNFPNTVITVGQLATHTSTILDGDFSEKNIVLTDTSFFSDAKNDIEDYNYLREKSQNNYMPLREYLENALNPEGDWYSDENFAENEPGSHYEYSNTAAALLAYIIELKTGLTFSEYTRNNILIPLGMKSSSWTFDKLPEQNYATLYSVHKNPLPDYRNITYPDGDLLSNITDLSILLREVVKGYYGKDTRILTSSSIQQMLSPHIPQSALPESYKDHKGNYGIFWQINPRGIIGHSGSTPGAFSYMFFNPEKGTGRIFLTNITATQDENLLKQAIEVLRTLGKFEDKI